MIPPSNPPLVRFTKDSEKLEYFRRWGLVTPKAKELTPVVYNGFYTDIAIPCEVIGHTWDEVAVIQIGSELHCIDGIHLADLQPVLKMYPRKKMPIGKALSDYVVLDIETTGLNRKHDAIIEISAALYHFREQIVVFHSLVNPGKPIPSITVSISHITDEMVCNAPTISDVIPSFISFIGDRPLVGHNIHNFDLPFIQEKLGYNLKNPYFDTLVIAKEKFPGLRTYQLGALCDILKIDEKPNHRATQDVVATASLFWRCASTVVLPSEEVG